MSGLKKIWDNIDVDSMEISVEEPLSAVVSRIGRKSRKANLALGSILIASSVSLLAIVHYFYPEPVPEMLECYVPFGEVRNLTLCDGTQVTLNSGTMFFYPEHFTGEKRTVYINGEGSFNVAKDAKHPFIVSTSDFDVRVLGTVFDVSAYAGDPYSNVVLAEGSVQMTGNSFDTCLSVGQKAEFSRNEKSLTVKDVEVRDYFAWNDGGLVFRGAGIEEITKALKRAYNVDVRYANQPKYTNACITFKSYEALTVKDFLLSLKPLIPGMRYSVDDTKVYLY